MNMIMHLNLFGEIVDYHWQTFTPTINPTPRNGIGIIGHHYAKF